MSVDKLLGIIEKSKFQDFLNVHDFKLVYKNHEKRGGIQDGYSVGFESHECKLGFYLEASIGVSVIPKFSDWETTAWIDLDYVISYLRKQPIKRDNTKKNLNANRFYDEILANILSDLAEEFEPLFNQIIKMFKDESVVDQWKPALEQYIKEDARRRYSLG